MNTAQATASAMLTEAFTLCNSGSIVLYNIPLPASPETALSGETTLATATFASAALSGPITYSAPNMVGSMAFTSTSLTPAAAGTAMFARAYQTGGTTAVADLTISAPWLASTAVLVGQYVTNGGNLYRCTTAGTTAASGGPTGTGSGITDGTAVWAYVQAGAGDITLANTSVQLGVTINITSAQFKMPAV